MQEELIEQEQIQETEKSFSDNLRESFFEEKPAVQNAEPPKEDAQPSTQPPVEEIIVPTDWLKKEFDIEDPAILKSEREELKTLREKVKEPKNFEFKNDDSRKAFELLESGDFDGLLDTLSNRKKIDKLSTADLNTNKDLVEDLVKFGIKNDNKDAKLSDEDVEFIFNEKYSKPAKPVRDELDEDADYEAKVKTWQQQVDNIDRRMAIEAKMAQPKIAQLKSELVFPDIKREGNQQQQLSQEDLNAMKENADEFSKFADTVINSFNGFTVQVKDKDVDYPVSYGSSQEEKTFIATELKNFAESNFDANALLAKRWVENDGKTIKVEQMVKDLSRIYYGEKAEQKIALDSGNKRIESYLKEKKQINLRETDVQQPSNVGEKTMSEKLAEQFFG